MFIESLDFGQLNDAISLGEQLANDKVSLMDLSVQKDQEVVLMKQKLEKYAKLARDLSLKCQKLRYALKSSSLRRSAEDLRSSRQKKKSLAKTSMEEQPKPSELTLKDRASSQQDLFESDESHSESDDIFADLLS